MDQTVAYKPKILLHRRVQTLNDTQLLATWETQIYYQTVLLVNCKSLLTLYLTSVYTSSTVTWLVLTGYGPRALTVHSLIVAANCWLLHSHFWRIYNPVGTIRSILIHTYTHLLESIGSSMATESSMPKFKPLSNSNYTEWSGEMRAWLMKLGY